MHSWRPPWRWGWIGCLQLAGSTGLPRCSFLSYTLVIWDEKSLTQLGATGLLPDSASTQLRNGNIGGWGVADWLDEKVVSLRTQFGYPEYS